VIKHVWSVLCERVITDENTNTISYFTCIERLNVLKLPATVPLITLGVLWEKSGKLDEELSFRLTFVRPDDVKEKLFNELHVVKAIRHRTSLVLNGMLINKYGTYALVLEMKKSNKWVVVSETSFVVVEKEEIVADLKPSKISAKSKK